MTKIQIPISNRPFQDLLVTAHNKEQIKEFITELIKFKGMGADVLTQFESWDFPKFPIEVPALRSKGLQCMLKWFTYFSISVPL